MIAIPFKGVGICYSADFWTFRCTLKNSPKMAYHLGICGSYDSLQEFIYTSKSKRHHSAIGWT